MYKLTCRQEHEALLETIDLGHIILQENVNAGNHVQALEMQRQLDALAEEEIQLCQDVEDEALVEAEGWLEEAGTTDD